MITRKESIQTKSEYAKLRNAPLYVHRKIIPNRAELALKNLFVL